MQFTLSSLIDGGAGINGEAGRIVKSYSTGGGIGGSMYKCKPKLSEALISTPKLSKALISTQRSLFKRK